MATLTSDEMTTRLVALVMSNEDCPQEFCDAVRRFCDEVAFGEFAAEYLKRSDSNEKI